MVYLLNAIYAGIAISIGGYDYLCVDNKILGAFLFSIGLSAVLIFGFNLYTGKVCYPESYKSKSQLPLTWIGNLAGTLACGLVFSYRASLWETARNLADAKMAKDPLGVFIDSIICGICIAFAVKGYKAKEQKDSLMSLIVILGVMTLILAGAEHVIADMFYFATAREFGLKALVFLVIVTAGNTLGGALFLRI